MAGMSSEVNKLDERIDEHAERMGIEGAALVAILNTYLDSIDKRLRRIAKALESIDEHMPGGGPPGG